MSTPQIIQQANSLAQQVEDIAGQVMGFARDQFAAGNLTIPDFNQAYSNYLSTLQRSRDIYYAVSHKLANDLPAAAINQILAAINRLQATLDGLQRVDSAIAVSLSWLVVAGTVAGAVMDPTHVTAAAAVASVGDLIAALD